MIENLRPGDTTGIDPEAVELATNRNGIVPVGAKITVIPNTWDLRGDFASVDIEMTIPDQNSQRHWVFLRKREGHWVIYASMPLDTKS
ncbi:MAG: hypothetical protein WEB06_13270 [Actinomycetota bacterium]